MPVIRAVTIHLDHYPLDPGLEDRVKETVSRVKQAAGRLGLKVWTFRLSLPVLERIDYNIIADVAGRLSEIALKYGLLVSGLNIDNPQTSIVRGIVDALVATSNVYASILVENLEDFKPYVEALYERTGSWQVFTRLALVFPERHLTPYFPASTTINGREGFTIALRYVDLVREAVSGGNENLLVDYLKQIEEFGHRLEEETGLEYLGTDASLSPWMEESVGELIEYLNNKPLPEPGTAWSINWLENYILNKTREAGLTLTGFNQLMLAVGEDNLLKQRALEGKLRLRDLALLSAYCVAGVDMAAFSIAETNKYDLLRLLHDTYTASRVKNKPLGIRLIPSIKRSGEKLVANRFGDIPVLKY